jgi:two-component system, response regulator, stage 0 sporulation protein F
MYARVGASLLSHLWGGPLRSFWPANTPEQGSGIRIMTAQPPIILLVDDDPEALILLHRLLHSFMRRHEIVAVESGVAALALTAVRPVALVITDYHMPGMNGVQLTGAIKAASPETRVAIVTAYDVHDVARRAKAVAADYVLPKPFMLAQLKQMIEECIPSVESDE